MSTKLEKGKWYVALRNGGWSLGRYLGKSHTHYMFTPSDFVDCGGWIGTGVKFAEKDEYFFIEVPTGMVVNQSVFTEWLISVLPE
jgi:hypothetical protein